MALAHLFQAGIDWEADLPPVEALCYEELTVLHTQLLHRLNSPSTSSMGRLFDAASALIGVRQAATYEGQAAIELEALAGREESGYYSFELSDGLVNSAPVWQALISDWRMGIPVPVLSARFHNSVVQMTVNLCKTIQHHERVHTVALSGGVWQNRYLLEHTCRALENSGFIVLTHHQVPANDGCIALGQAMIAAKAIKSTQ
jgi:hydrogenase maturation protein HypF